MKKKSQIRKYTVQKVADLLYSEQNPQVLQLYASHIKDKNQELIEKKNSLIQQLTKSRNRMEGFIRQMNDGVQSRIQKAETVIMTAKSRPSQQDIKSMTGLFSYMQDQGQKIQQNNSDIIHIQTEYAQKNDKIRFPSFSYQSYDKKYEALNKQCAKQTIAKQQLQKKLEANRQFYKNIQQSIEKCREQYQIVESGIRQKQRQLLHLQTYFKNRKREDQQNINRQNALTDQLQAELLKAQQIVNYNMNKDNGLLIQTIEGNQEANGKRIVN